MTFYEVVLACFGMLAASAVFGLVCQSLNLPRTWEVGLFFAGVTALTVANIGIATQLPLGNWTSWGYSITALATSVFFYTGWLTGRSWYNRQTFRRNHQVMSRRTSWPPSSINLDELGRN